MAAVALQLLTDVVADFQPSDREGTVLGSLIGPNDRAAGAAGLAAQITQLEQAAGNRIAGHTVPLVDHQGGQRGVLKAEGVPLSRRDERLLGVAVLDGESGGRLQLLYPEPAVPQAVGRAGQFDAAVLVRREDAQVVVFAGLRIVAGIPHLEAHVGQRLMGNGIFLDDFDGRGLVVFKIHIPVPVGIEGHELGLRIQQIGRRHRFFGYLIHRGQEVGNRGGAVRPGLDLGNGMAVRATHQEYRPLNGRATICVPFPDGQIGSLIVFQHDGAVFAGKQFHMVFLGVQDVVGQRICFPQGIDPRL